MNSMKRSYNSSNYENNLGPVCINFFIDNSKKIRYSKLYTSPVSQKSMHCKNYKISVIQLSQKLRYIMLILIFERSIHFVFSSLVLQLLVKKFIQKQNLIHKCLHNRHLFNKPLNYAAYTNRQYPNHSNGTSSQRRASDSKKARIKRKPSIQFLSTAASYYP